MQVQMSNQASIVQDLMRSNKGNDTFQATVKEQLGKNEAIVTVNGKDMRVKYNGELPKDGNVTLKIKGVDENGVVDVDIVDKQAKAEAQQQLTETMLPEEQTEIEKILKKNGVRLNPAELKALKKFLASDVSKKDKVKTVEMMIKKQLTFTDTHLKSVNEALNGEPLGDLLATLIEKMPSLLEAMGQATENQQMQWQDSIGQNNAQNLTPEQMAETAQLLSSFEAINQVSIESKQIIVTEVTLKMAQSAHEFKMMKREITFKLDTIQASIQKPTEQTKTMLESVIQKLDRSLTDSSFLLFADMKTEKQVIQATNQLQNAKELLRQGKNSEASTIVDDVKKLMDQLEYKPSDVKVKNFVEQQTYTSMSMKLSNQFNFMKSDGSIRQTAEYFRQVGFSHERDVQQSMFKQTIPSMQNMKAMLLSLSQGDKVVEQAVSNITGQQLLNKTEPTSPTQSMQMQIPLYYEQQVQTVNLYFQGQNEGGSLDWKNCTMFFLLKSEKYGEIGISLQSLERQLSITIKNDSEQFHGKMKNIFDTAKESLEEIGYDVKNIQVTTLREKEIKKPVQVKSEEGYDITI